MTTQNSVNVGLSGSSGTGSFAGTTSPTFTTPVLGTPTSGNLANCTGLPVAGGGTGDASFTAYTVLCGGTTTTGALQNVASVGTTGQVLTSNGASALPTFQTNPAGITALLNVQVLTSASGTYTPTAGTAAILVEVVGGGGGGGGAIGGAGSTSIGGGGGGGGLSRLYISSPAASYSYVAGGGGAGGIATTGGTGTTSTFGTGPLVQATGGAGGLAAPSTVTTSGVGAEGGNGGVGSIGNFNSYGGPGALGLAILGSSYSGSGGNSYVGGGGVGINNAVSNGNVGNVYGGGGSGAVCSTVSKTGGAGAAGVIFIWEFS